MYMYYPVTRWDSGVVFPLQAMNGIYGLVPTTVLSPKLFCVFTTACGSSCSAHGAARVSLRTARRAVAPVAAGGEEVQRWR